MKLTLMIIALVFTAAETLAEDVITLKSGKALRGEVLEYEDGKLTIQTTDGRTTRGKISGVQRIQFGEQESGTGLQGTTTEVRKEAVEPASSPSAPKKANTAAIASYTGKGGKNTRPFTVPAGWEIQWDARGDIFQLFLYNADGSIAGVPANQQGSGKGTSYQAKAGKYYLQVNAMGKWSIKVVDVE